MRKVGVEIFGSPAGLIRAFRASGAAAGVFGRELQEVAVSAQRSAEKQVQAAVRSERRLREQIVAYEQLGAAAKAGSREQIAAANLAADAQARLARSSALTAREQRALLAASGRSSRGARDAEQGWRRAGRIATAPLRAAGRGVTAVTGFGPGMLGTAGGVFGLFKLVSEAATFQRVMNIFRQVSGASRREMRAARLEAIQLGNDIHLPATSARDAAEAMTELSKAGLDVHDTIGAARGVLQLSAAADISNADAAAIAARNLNAFGLEGRQATHIADLLAAAANATSGEITDIAEALSYTAATAHQAHVPIEDTVAAIGEMANKGILGSQSGAAMQQMLLRLESPTKKAKAALDSMGVSIYDEHGKLRPLRDIIAQFSAATAHMSDKQRNAAMNTIFGSRAIRAANIVLLGGVAAYDKMRAAVDKQGAAARLAGARNQGLAGGWDALESAAETVAIRLGTTLIPQLNHYVRRAAAWLGNTRNQVRIQRTFTQVMQRLGQVIKTGAAITIAAARAADKVAHAIGGWHNATKFIIAGILLHKLLAIRRALLGVRDAEFAAAAASGTLRKGLLGLTSLRIVIPIVLLYEIAKHRQQIEDKVHGLDDGPGRSPDRWLRKHVPGYNTLFGKPADYIENSFFGKPRREKRPTGPGDYLGETIKAAREATRPVRPDDRAGPRGPSTQQGRAGAAQAAADAADAEQRRQDLEAKRRRQLAAQRRAREAAAEARRQIALTRAERTKTLADDIAALRAEEDAIKQQLHNHRLSLQKQLELEQELTSVESQLAQARQEQRERRQQARQREIARRNARQFRLLGLGPTGETLAPTKRALKAELGSVEQAIAGTFLDTRAHQGLLRKIRRLLSGQLGALSADMRSKLKELMDDLKGQLNEFDGFNLTKAEKRRRFLDRERAREDRYRARGHQHEGRGKTEVHHHHHRTIVHAHHHEDLEQTLRRAQFRARHATV